MTTRSDRVYRVTPADSVFLIALRYKTTKEALLAANDLENGRLYPGLELQIPS